MIQENNLPTEKYRGRIIRVATQEMKFPDGSIKQFEFAERSPGVRILVVSKEKILLTKEWRTETKMWDYRLPGGKMFDSLVDYIEKKESQETEISKLAIHTAQKELHEETGLHVPLDLFKEIHRSVCGATIVWDLYYFLVNTTAESHINKEIKTHEGEHTFPQWISFNEAKNFCLTNQIQEDRSVAVILKFILAQDQ